MSTSALDPLAHPAKAHCHAPSEGAPAKGRAVSARNATTHGLFARDVVLPTLGEDPAAFDALLAQLCAQLPPRNLLERHYVEQIAAASWRLRRLHRWQAQVWEDGALNEDQRLDKLDKTLRQENTLTRQIDRAVRLLGRDLMLLFNDRARDGALRDQDATEADCRESLDLAIAVQRQVWQDRDDAGADADLKGAHLDNTQICENEPGLSDSLPAERAHGEVFPPPSSGTSETTELPPLSVAAIVQENLRKRISPAGWDAPTPPVTPTFPTPAVIDNRWDDEELDEDDPDYVDEYGFGKGERPDMREICENETATTKGSDGDADKGD